MNKAELIEALADKTGLQKQEAKRKYWMLTSRS